MDLDLAPDAGSLAVSAAHWLAGRIRHYIHVEGRCDLALSGGSTPGPMLGQLARLDLPWSSIHIFQVDERVAPEGDPSRNAGQLTALAANGACLHLMPVTEGDLAAAAARYSAMLVDECNGRLHVVHLGIGDDGHTASWPPGDTEVLESDDIVTVTGVFRGKRRMTLTPRCVNRAGEVMFLVSGAGKADVLRRVMEGDESLPAGLVRQESTTVFADRAAFAG